LIEDVGRPDAAFRVDPKPPFSTLQLAAMIDGIHTEFILTTYSNLVFFVVTQLEKLGSLLLARRELTMEGEPTFAISSLLGRRDPEIEIYARKLVEVTSKRSAKPLLLSLALKDNSPSTFRQIIAFISKHVE